MTDAASNITDKAEAKKRVYSSERNTAETEIKYLLNLDGDGKSKINTRCGFLNHMLTLLAKHSGFDIEIECIKDDHEVDYHHLCEDIGIALGNAFSICIGDKTGIRRYADTVLPMDESLVLSAVDISGRGYYASELNIKAPKVGDFDTELTDEFWRAFSVNAGITLHIKQLSGTNAHHIIECVFKSVARSLRFATELDPRFSTRVPSTKGVL